MPTDTLLLRHPDGLRLTLSARGATWLSCEVPMGDGSSRSVVLPRVEPPDAATRGAYLGATIGRYANRIGQGRISHGGRVWQLHTNPGSRHQLHGGPDGFDARVWSVDDADERSVRLALVSADGDQGYPGELRAQVVYRLADAMTIEMEATASVSAPSPVCLTNHAYFNLDGVAGDVRRHRLRIAAQRYLPVDAELIPLGPLAKVQGTSFDFRDPQTLLARWCEDEQQRQAGGYDHAFLLDAGSAAAELAAA
ncbi:MAG TPA: galactose-1-epimerase, partial [Albitalea sp.]|uniref:galactose-1-epimerase n=1 Tax=Piscinibacter sp. TaxID=1903157 RepID=UPI002ED19070